MYANAVFHKKDILIRSMKTQCGVFWKNGFIITEYSVPSQLLSKEGGRLGL